MEISEREYEELKEQIKILQNKINGIEKPKSNFCDLVEEMPITFVRNSVEDFPDFVYEKGTHTDVWKLFTQMAKMIHSESWKFYMDTAQPPFRIAPRPYIRVLGNHEYPKKITNMTTEQIKVSVQMLNEMIPIYNKYFKKMHPYVLYSDNQEGSYRKIFVEKIEEE